MGIAVNLVTYLGGTMHLPSAESANVVSDFLGTSFLLCLLGGFLADSFLGRYLTVAIFALVQALVRPIVPSHCNGSHELAREDDSTFSLRVLGNRNAHCIDEFASAPATAL